MKTLLIILTILSISRLTAQEEYKTHIESIRKVSCGKLSPSSILKDTNFLDYAINEIIEPEDVIYISNRKLLQNFVIDTCSKWNVEMVDTINDTTIIEIAIKAKEFNPDENIIEKFKDEKYNDHTESINGLRAYGATYKLPEVEFSNIQILVNDLPIEIPDTVFKNLYEANLCQSYGFVRPVEAFTSLDGKYIYLYVYGGNAAGTYFTKLIFDHKRFITKWTVDYGVLSVFGCFTERFIGF